MSDVIIKAQANMSYAHVQEVARLLPDAIAETFPGVMPNVMKAVNNITSAVTGIAPAAFFCVAEIDAEVVGFFGGVMEGDVFSDRRFARDIFAWVRPSARGSTAYRDMARAFEQWATEAGAEEVRGILLADSAEKIASAAEHEGYTRAGIVIFKKVT